VALAESVNRLLASICSPGDSSAIERLRAAQAYEPLRQTKRRTYPCITHRTADVTNSQTKTGEANAHSTSRQPSHQKAKRHTTQSAGHTKLPSHNTAYATHRPCLASISLSASANCACSMNNTARTHKKPINTIAHQRHTSAHRQHLASPQASSLSATAGHANLRTKHAPIASINAHSLHRRARLAHAHNRSPGVAHKQCHHRLQRSTY